MPFIAKSFILLVGFFHFCFLILEIFLWRSPIGQKIFGMSASHAETTAILAANQGLYNGFLAAGLFVSFFLEERTSYAFRLFFLLCVISAGLYGALTVNYRIFIIQALPGIIALLLTILYLKQSGG